MKSRIAPNTFVFQLEVQDFKHRQPAPHNLYIDKSGKGIKEIVDSIPIITLFRHAKNSKQAIRSARKKGTVISCQKVDSHVRRLDMMNHLRVDQKPMEVDIKVEDFTIGRDLIISPPQRGRKIEL
jgi:hypothetical protein